MPRERASLPLRMGEVSLWAKGDSLLSNELQLPVFPIDTTIGWMVLNML
jgi:hypothetical protein